MTMSKIKTRIALPVPPSSIDKTSSIPFIGYIIDKTTPPSSNTIITPFIDIDYVIQNTPFINYIIDKAPKHPLHQLHINDKAPPSSTTLMIKRSIKSWLCFSKFFYILLLIVRVCVCVTGFKGMCLSRLSRSSDCGINNIFTNFLSTFIGFSAQFTRQPHM